MKLLINEENIERKDELFLATDIFPGFEFAQERVEEETIMQFSGQSIGEVLSLI